MHNRILVIFIILAVAPFAWPVLSSAQIEVIPGNSLQGAALFREKGCVKCHAFRGAGARVGPDLAQPNERTHTPMQLATALWNHDLLKRPGPDLLTGYVAAMWNHAPLMHSRAGSEFPSGPWRSGSFNRSAWPRSGDSLLKSLMKSGIRSVPFPLMSSWLKMNGKTPTILAVKDDTWSTIFNT